MSGTQLHNEVGSFNLSEPLSSESASEDSEDSDNENEEPRRSRRARKRTIKVAEES